MIECEVCRREADQLVGTCILCGRKFCDHCLGIIDKSKASCRRCLEGDVVDGKEAIQNFKALVGSEIMNDAVKERYKKKCLSEIGGVI